MQLRDCDRTFHMSIWFVGVGLWSRRTVNMPTTNTAAGQQCAEPVDPMITSTCRIDLWGASKLTATNDERGLQQTAFFQSFQQSSNAFVQGSRRT